MKVWESPKVMNIALNETNDMPGASTFDLWDPITGSVDDTKNPTGHYHYCEQCMLDAKSDPTIKWKFDTLVEALNHQASFTDTTTHSAGTYIPVS